MIITWLAFGHQPEPGKPAPLLGEIKLEVDDDKHKMIMFPQANAIGKQLYGDAFAYAARKSRTEWHPKRHPSTITIYE
jgi:hypothetical protein